MSVKSFLYHSTICVAALSVFVLLLSALVTIKTPVLYWDHVYAIGLFLAMVASLCGVAASFAYFGLKWDE